MTDKEQIAPSLEELSYTQVQSSHLFGFTNISGKALSLLSLSALGVGGTGVAQGLGFMAPVMGMSMSFTAGLVTLGASVVTGLVGYWLGNFDDKHIKAHNSRASRAFGNARGATYQKIEHGFMEALTKVEYDPGKNSLPYDALGHAVLLTDEKIKNMPPHIQVDIYRTQLDLELYAHSGLTSHTSIEGQRFEEKIMGKSTSTMEAKATAYKNCRDNIRIAIKDGTLSATPVSAQRASTRADNDDRAGIVTDVALDLLNVAARMPRGGMSSGAGKIFRGGGGDFGGGGASGSWDDLASAVKGGSVQSLQGQGMVLGGLGTGFDSSPPVYDMPSGLGLDLDIGSGSGGGSSFDLDLDGDAAPVLLVVAGVAAALAASAVAGVSIWKNFVNSAEKPALGNVHLPMIAKSLKSAEKEVRRMYTPS